MHPGEPKLVRLVIVFCLGFILGMMLCSIAIPSGGTEQQIEELKVAVGHNTEEIAQLREDVRAIKDWVLATDKQSVADGEERGELKTTVAAHDKLIWLVGADTIGFLFLLLKAFLWRGRRTALDR